MRYLAVVLLLMVCAPARAATMCIPDLSTCESCTPVGTEENMWIADCCGVRVSGYALLFFLPLWGDEQCVSVSQPIGDRFLETHDDTVIACLMIAPSKPKYTYIIRPTDYYNYQIYLQDCAASFNPKCVFSECSETLCGNIG